MAYCELSPWLNNCVRPTLKLVSEKKNQSKLRKINLALWLCLCLVPLHTISAQDVYAIDPNQSTIGFAVKHMVISSVYGKFTEYQGTILLDEVDLTKSSVDITIRAGSINTDVTARDNDLRSANFLDASKYPDISFHSLRVWRQDDKYVLSGELSMHGVTKKVAIPFKYNGKIKDLMGNTRVAVEGSLTIDRRDWGIIYSKVLDNGGLVAGDDVKITLDIEAVRKQK